MLKYKRNLLIFIISCIIYFIFSYIYSLINTQNKYVQSYILKSDVKKGEMLTENNILKVKINNSNYNFDNSNISRKVFKDNYSKNQIITDDMFVDKDKYLINTNDNTEIISIKIKELENSVSNNLVKNSIVNIYYTSKTIQAKDILEKLNIETIQSSNEIDGYITVKLLSNVKILELYNKDGVALSDVNQNFKEISNKLIDTIVVELSKNEIMRICNLKQYGDFTISLIK